MTTLLSAQSLHLEADSHPLFQDLSFTLSIGARIGLVGHNGCGKSTLLRLLSGQQEARSGSLQRAHLLRLQHVEQHLPPEVRHASTREALACVVPHQPWRVAGMLALLGLEPATADLPVAALSGGQHTRLLLGRALLQDPNLLLLDEPSNHLDLPALMWLERFLTNWSGGFILVSHDQRLLDNVTRQTWVLRDARLYTFDQPCTTAMQSLAAHDQAASARFEAEQKEIERLQASSKRLAIWGKTYDNEDLARKAKTMQKRVDKLVEQQTFVSNGAPWRLRLCGKAMAANQILAFENWPVRPAPEGPILFAARDLWLKPGDRVALIGANGKGKSSLLRQIWRALGQGDQGADAPGWYVHPAAQIGYYDQSLQQLADQATLIDAPYPIAPLPEVTRRHALINAGFAYARHGQKVASLSGGERARLLFLALSLASYHLLLLDEPTNHLDMAGKRELAATLREFAGSTLLVSHDRDLIEAACTRFWVLAQGQLVEMPDAGRAYQYLAEMEGSGTLRTEAAGRTIAGACTATRNDGSTNECVSAQEADRQFERLCELEQLLAADLARKPKHQKPQAQAQWRQEMANLSQVLGLN